MRFLLAEWGQNAMILQPFRRSLITFYDALKISLKTSGKYWYRFLSTQKSIPQLFYHPLNATISIRVANQSRNYLVTFQ